MARNRLGDMNRNYGDAPAPQPVSTYPPPANAVIGQSRAPNPYAQQNVAAAPGATGNYNTYGGNNGAGNPYATQQQQYGQQEQYAIGGNAAAAVDAGGDFWSELSNTNANLSTLQEQIQAVRSAHQQSLTSTDPQAATYATQLNDQAKATREQCAGQLKKLYKLAKGDKAMKNQAQSCKTRFQGLLQEHQVIESEFRKKVRERAGRQYRIVNPQATDEEVQQVLEQDSPQIFSQALLNSNRYGAARGAYREVQERHAEIQKIEKTLTELAQMFQEMAMLVEQQDEVIVNVEQQAKGVDQDVTNGLKQTERAVDSARKARRKKWICFWICVLIVVILALVLGLVFGLRSK